MFNIFNYLVDAFAILFIFKALDVEPWKAFIPVYNYYKVFYEYSGRVYKKKWHNIYLISLGLYIVFVLLFQAYTFSYMVSDIDSSMQRLIINTSVLIIIFAVIGIIFNLLIFYPVVHNQMTKILFYIMNIIYLISAIAIVVVLNTYTILDFEKSNYYTEYILGIIGLLNRFIGIYIAYSFNKKVVDNNITIQGRLNIDKNSITYETIFEIEKRNKKLI